MQRVGEVQPFRMPFQGINDSRPLLDAHIGQAEQILDGTHKICGLKAVEGTKYPFELEYHTQRYEELIGAGDEAARDGPLLHRFEV